MKEKKNEGITLIALVITIIVLLILAGVTLSTLFGNNGILTESQLAVEANKEANAKEQVQLAWTACETEYQAAWTKDSSVEKSNYFKKENLNKNLGTGEVKSVGYVENGKSTVTYTLDGTEYEFEIANGQVYKVGQAPDVTKPMPEESQEPGTLVKTVTKDNYGDTINYSANGISDWKIFYNDGDNVFIIADKYLTIDKLPQSLSIESDEDNIFWWSREVESNKGASAIDEAVAKKFGLNWIFTGNHRNSTNTNIQCVQELMDTEKWSNFATGVDGAIAIGASTLEMWINSRNQKYPDEFISYNAGGDYDSDGTIYDENYDVYWDEWESRNAEYYELNNKDYGYQIFMKSEKWLNRNLYDDGKIKYRGKGYSTGIPDSFLTNDLLYDVGILSAPCACDSEALFWGGSSHVSPWGTVGSINDPYHYEQEQDFKPVVCLPSSVNATKSGSNWIIEH